MSMETRKWLSENTLIGFTAQRGQAWHWRQGDTNNYPDAVPMERVDDLFRFTVDPQTIYVMDPSNPFGFSEIPGMQAWARSDTSKVLGIFTDRYAGHQYSEWLVDNVKNILHGQLGVASAGLLRDGRQAWVQVEVPDSFEAPSGELIRPSILAASSFDGSIATRYSRVMTRVVCDNTLACALRERGATVKFRSTSGSVGKLADARQALELIERDAESFSADIAELLAVKVDDAQWTKIRDRVLAPMPPEGKTTRGATLCESKRGELEKLYRHDDRVSPWAGTAWGVLQADSTYRQHVRTVKSVTREERNMINMVEGVSASDDMATVKAIMELVS